MPTKKKHWWKSYRKQILTLVGIHFALLVVLVLNRNDLPAWFGQAQVTPANIIVDVPTIIGPQPRPWNYLAQGGESPQYRLVSIADKVAKLEPEYIRIDHVFDFYDIVQRAPDGQLLFNWKSFDLLLDDIEAVGAKPFISLSYMPPVISSGDITDPPLDWGEWQRVIKETVEHISGQEQRNIQEVYYEVWNEPDLFGRWNRSGSRNYLDMYKFAALGALEAENTNQFYFGGPAVTAFYPNWFKDLFSFVEQENLPLDFISWHRYDRDETQFYKDAVAMDKLLEDYPNFIGVEKIISEWGHESDIDRGFDTDLSAAHLVASSVSMGPWVDKAFVFEIEDGKDNLGRNLWGRWGLLTHRDFGAVPKPRYKAMELLNNLGDQKIAVSGNGSFVKSMATKRQVDILTETEAVQVLVTNYDRNERNSEVVPITFNRITPGEFRIQETYLEGGLQEYRVATDAAQLKHQVVMLPNSVVMVELEKIE